MFQFFHSFFWRGIPRTAIAFFFLFCFFPVHDGLYFGGPSTKKEVGMDSFFGGFGLSVYPVRTVMAMVCEHQDK